MALGKGWFDIIFEGLKEEQLELMKGKEMKINGGLRLKAEIENTGGGKTKVIVNSGKVEALFDWQDAEDVIKLLEDMIHVRNTLNQSKFVEDKV